MIKLLLNAGVHLGHSVKEVNPQIVPFLRGSRNGQSIFDLKQTLSCLRLAVKVRRAVQGKIWYVGGRHEIARLMMSVVKSKGNSFYPTWPGGALTNKSEGGNPQLIILFNRKGSEGAIREAARCNIPVIAVVDSDCSLYGVSYPIPGNDDNLKAQFLYMSLLK